MSSVDLSVVIATFNRQSLLRELLSDLAAQTLARARFEVIVVDDGSDTPVLLDCAAYPYSLTLIRQKNTGVAIARDQGIQRANGKVIVILDDDMSVRPDFLALHLAHYATGVTVVLGGICSETHWENMPLFERFHAQKISPSARRENAKVQAPPSGMDLCTGNVSFQRVDYLAVGGFDPTLEHSEDRDLGIRLEKAGARFAYDETALSTHRSDHTDRNRWLRRAKLYGIFDRRIADKHPTDAKVDPWAFLGRVNPISRPWLLLAALSPPIGEKVARAALSVAEQIDHYGLEKVGLAGTTFSYGLQYFSGVGEQSGGPLGSLDGLIDFLTKAWPNSRLAGARFIASVLADYRAFQYYRLKYQGQRVSTMHLPLEAVRRIGFQMMVAIRAMRLARDVHLPLGAQTISRMIRHLYGAEIHWNAELADGIWLVHGNGLVIGAGASIGKRCILFQNVTLGVGTHPETREVGSPTVEDEVHIGPGATLLGAITIGTRSKIMAGAVLDRSVPAGSVVKPAEAVVSERKSNAAAHRLAGVAKTGSSSRGKRRGE